MSKHLGRCFSQLEKKKVVDSLRHKIPCVCSQICISQHSDIWNLFRYYLESSLYIFQISCLLSQKNIVLRKGLAVRRHTLRSWHCLARYLGQIA